MWSEFSRERSVENLAPPTGVASFVGAGSLVGKRWTVQSTGDTIHMYIHRDGVVKG